MNDKQTKRLQTFTLAFGIAFLPPIWAVLASFIGVRRVSCIDMCRSLCRKWQPK